HTVQDAILLRLGLELRLRRLLDEAGAVEAQLPGGDDRLVDEQPLLLPGGGLAAEADLLAVVADGGVRGEPGRDLPPLGDLHVRRGLDERRVFLKGHRLQLGEGKGDRSRGCRGRYIDRRKRRGWVRGLKPSGRQTVIKERRSPDEAGSP